MKDNLQSRAGRPQLMPTQEQRRQMIAVAKARALEGDTSAIAALATFELLRRLQVADTEVVR